MTLRTRLSRLKRKLRPEPIRIELDVVEQLITLHLVRYGQAGFDELFDAVSVAWATATPQQVRLSLIRFESLRLAVRLIHPGEEPGMTWRLTEDGQRLRKVIPSIPRSSLQTYL